MHFQKFIPPAILLIGLILIVVSQSVKQPEYSKYSMNNKEFNQELKTSRVYLGIGVAFTIMGSFFSGKALSSSVTQKFY